MIGNLRPMRVAEIFFASEEIFWDPFSVTRGRDREERYAEATNRTCRFSWIIDSALYQVK